MGTFVHDEDGTIDGFVAVSLVPAPPVYDPGGASAVIDDFVVSSPERWPSAGAALLESATAWARAQGAAQVVAVCGRHDEAKRRLLHGSGLSVTSEWFTAPLGP